VIYALLAFALVALTVVCVGLALRFREAKAAGERAEMLAAQVMQADERARREIAQNLHDQALQTLLTANQELQEASPGRVGVMRAHTVVSATIEELREAVASLHPVTLEQGGLKTALSAVARRAQRQGGFEALVDVEADLPSTRDELILAIARELLNNVAAHAEAKHVEVWVRRVDRRVELCVSDDGKGIEPGRRQAALEEGHIGIASAAHRIEISGGTFQLEPNETGGTVARAILPLI
jgi:two-component system NarL family sensor kinase